MSRRRHHMAFRRFAGHMVSVWCSCGWSVPEPTKLVRKWQIVAKWREHLAPSNTPERGDLTG